MLMARAAAAPLPAPEAAAPAPAAPLSADPAAFWSAGSLPDDVFGDVQSAPVSGAWLQRLGNFPFWRGERPLLDALEPVYEGASRRGLDTFLGGRSGQE